MSDVAYNGPRREVPLAERREIIERVLAQNVDWVARDGGEWGYCECPGIANHGNRNGPRDCRVWAVENGSKPPGIHCLHTSCSALIEEVNHKLRSEIGKAKVRGLGYDTPRPIRNDGPQSPQRTGRTPAFSVSEGGDLQSRTARTDKPKPLTRYARAHVHARTCAHTQANVPDHPSDTSEVAPPVALTPQPTAQPPPVQPTTPASPTDEKTDCTLVYGDRVEKGRWVNGEWECTKRINL